MLRGFDKQSHRKYAPPRKARQLVGPDGMPLEYSCFISYRHARGALGEAFIDQLEAALTSELAQQTNMPVYVDKTRLQGGDFFTPALEEAVCKSACMVMVYTPRYFDACETYCAREYKAMVNLEEERFEALGGTADRSHGLIIPVIFRGKKFLPAAIGDHRHFHDFTDFLLAGEELARHPQYAEEIRDMAEYVKDRCDGLEQLGDMYNQCKDFRFPSDDEISGWLPNVLPPLAKFPGVN